MSSCMLYLKAHLADIHVTANLASDYETGIFELKATVTGQTTDNFYMRVS